ncbi:MAG: hypothetical protein AAF602_33425, partial [Myxococcota bacterium]
MIARTITVEVAVETAFRAFTDHIGRWWPADHVPGGARLLGVRFDRPEVGAELIMETDARGSFAIGRITSWSPPHGLAYDFFIGSSP